MKEFNYEQYLAEGWLFKESESYAVRLTRTVYGYDFLDYIFDEESYQRAIKRDPGLETFNDAEFECVAQDSYDAETNGGGFEVLDDGGLYTAIMSIRIPKVKQACLDLYDKILNDESKWEGPDPYDCPNGGDGPDD